MVKVFDKNNKEINLTENPNLLVNADFRYGAINQKNKTEYTGNVYGADRWLSKSANGKVIVNSDSLVFTTKNEYSVQFTQYIYQDLRGAKLTFALKIKNIVGIPRLNLLGIEYALKVGLNVFTYKVTSENMPSSNKQYFYFNLNGGDSIEFEFMKLEIGEDFTGMPVWNYADELLKCLSKMVVIPTNQYIGNGYITYDGKAVVLIPNTFGMTKKPQIYISSNFLVVYGNGKTSTIPFNLNSIQISNANILLDLKCDLADWKYHAISCRLDNSNMVIDANDY